MRQRAIVTWLLLCVLAFPAGLMVGCGPEGAGSAPKLKGSKDEIQKQMQPPGEKGVGHKRR